MYKLKTADGKNNIVGKNLKHIRETKFTGLSQRALAKKMQLVGYDMDHHVIRRIENGERFVTDIDIIAFSTALDVSFEELLNLNSTQI